MSKNALKPSSTPTAPAASTAGCINVVCAPPPPPEPPDPCVRGAELLAEYQATYRPDASPSRSDYLLALVPDPELPEQTSNFDAVLEGVEEAATEKNAFVRDRQWLPWGEDVKGCADKAPGVLLFRPAIPSAQAPRIVLLVGETPSWGVRKTQLRAAIDGIPAPDASTKADAAALPVLGPTYSGSAASVLALLGSDDVPAKALFRFVSGSATSPHLRDLFKARLGEGSFAATVPNDQLLLQAMRGYLEKRRFWWDKIAILSEAGTAYGSSVSDVAKPSAGKNDPAVRDDVITLRFPVDLRPLRKAVATAPSATGSVEQAPQVPDDPRVLVLDEVARELSRQRVRFVGVVATNPADVVLLTRRLRAQLPDARFFTLGGDILYTSTSLASPLNGMLVAHAAPPHRLPAELLSSVSMKSELVRNVFLAGHALYHPQDEVPLTTARISLIGNGALWEIGDLSPQPQPPRSWRIVSITTWLVFLLIVVLSIWPWLAHKYPSVAHTTLTRQRGPLTLAVGHCERGDLRTDDAFVTAGLLSVAAGAPLLVLIAEVARTSPQVGFWCKVGAPLLLLSCWGRVLTLLFKGKLGKPRFSALVCGVLALAAAGLALGIGCAPPHEATLNLLSGGSAVLAGLIAFGMLAIGLWCWRMRLRFLDNHRFGGGSRMDQPPLAEALGQKPAAGTGFFELEAQLLETIHSPWNGVPLVPWGVHFLLALSIGLVFSVRIPAGFEPEWRNHLVIGFGILALLPITVNFSRIIATFVLLNRLLKRLSLLPILERLRKLPPELSRKLQAQLTVANADMTELARPIALLGSIASAFPALPLKAQETRELWESALRHQAGEPVSAKVVHEQAHIMNNLLEASALLQQQRDPELKELASDYLALLVAILVPRYLRHFRLYVVPVMMGSVLGVMMTSLYFIQPQRLVMTVIFVWVAGMVLTTFLIYMALDRSAIISAIGDSTEGSVDFDWTLTSRILTWGVVPLLSLLAAQYPGFSSWMALVVSGLGSALR